MRSVISVFALLALTGLTACGGGGGTSTPTPVAPPPPPTPAASITTVGSGNVIVHPSADSRFFYALETPIRVTENSGGNADWNYARLSSFRRGTEIERSEIGSDTIRAAGFSRIGANSNHAYNVYFHINHEDFDDLVITLGFGDVKDGRQFTTTVPFSTFAGVDISLTPKSVPSTGKIELGR